MSAEFARGLIAFAAALFFGLGLLVSGMADPQNVLGFLDVFGAWNPRLLFVMIGAIGIHAPVYLWVRRQARPWLAPRFVIPTRRDLDVRLFVGASLFGVGWGISGYCPGPAFVSLPSGHSGLLVFVAAMVVGSLLQHSFSARSLRPVEPPQPASR